MTRSPAKAWWLLALCGVFEAVIAILYFALQKTNGPLTFHVWNVTVMYLGRLILAAGFCLIAAGLWRSAKGKSWFLVLNGLALSALGVIYVFFVGHRISFRTIALLIVVMALSAAIPEVATARAFRRQHNTGEGWLLALAGLASVAFALAFVALGFGWIKIEPGSHTDLLCLSLYFAFSAVCMLAFALRLSSGRLVDYRHA